MKTKNLKKVGPRVFDARSISGHITLAHTTWPDRALVSLSGNSIQRMFAVRYSASHDERATTVDGPIAPFPKTVVPAAHCSVSWQCDC